MSRFGRIVDTALAGPTDRSATPWLHMVEAVPAEYRAGEGHYEAAVHHLYVSRQELTHGEAAVTIDLLRRMCLHRLGKASEARAAYRRPRASLTAR